MRRLSKIAFSLIELMVAISIFVIVGTAITLVLSSAFKVWDASIFTASSAVKESRFISSLDRAFQSVYYTRPFTGEVSYCEFQTAFAHDATPRTARFEGFFEYGAFATNKAAEIIWQKEWFSTNSAPNILRVKFAADSAEHVLIRGTP